MSDQAMYLGIDQVTELRYPPLIGDLLVLTKSRHQRVIAQIEERVGAALKHGPSDWSMTDAIVGGRTRRSCVACNLPWPHAIDWHAVVTGEGEPFDLLDCNVTVNINGKMFDCTQPDNHYGAHTFSFVSES
jgi:hypothetical protein